MFVRYDPDGEHNPKNPSDSFNREDFNWEASTGWCCPTDNYYMKTVYTEKPEELKNLKKSDLIINTLWRAQKVYILLE